MNGILRVKDIGGDIELRSTDGKEQLLAVPPKNLDKFHSILPLVSSGTYPIDWTVELYEFGPNKPFKFVLRDEGASYEVCYDGEIKSIKIDF